MSKEGREDGLDGRLTGVGEVRADRKDDDEHATSERVSVICRQVAQRPSRVRLPTRDSARKDQ